MKRIIIMGAAGRDFHNFLTYFRDNPGEKVVCFTAAQIPGIEKRSFPRQLAGTGYDNDIPVFPEEKLPELIRKYKADDVVLAYSDLSNQDVMTKASIVLAAGANFRLLGKQTMLKSSRPVIAVCAVRTGVGKSPTTRYVAGVLRSAGKRVAVLRHPMPYGDLMKQRVQRFATAKDLRNCTIEEREEFEPLIENGHVVYAGVDYREILRRAEKEADVIIWDGGNNDIPFLVPDLHIVLVDPHRPGHELTYYPGQANARMADLILVGKANTAKPSGIRTVMQNSRMLNAKAPIIRVGSQIAVQADKPLKGRKVLVVEDGPTLTHGNMPYGAGTIAAKENGARIIDPKRFAVGSIRDVYKKYPLLGPVLPAVGYSPKQILELEKTINRVPCDVVLDATPANLQTVLKVAKPVIRVTYELQDKSGRLKKEVLKAAGAASRARALG